MKNINIAFEINLDDNVWEKTVFQVYRATLYENDKEIGYMKIVLIPHETKVFSTFKNYLSQWKTFHSNQEYYLREEYKNNKKFFHKKALIAYSNIEVDYQGQGYGQAMYKLVNEKIKEMGYILGSDTTRSVQANNLWNKLIAKDFAYFENRRFYLK